MSHNRNGSTFRTRRLQRCAASRTEATKRSGPKVAERYHDRLNLLRSVDSLSDLAPSRALHLHPLGGLVPGLGRSIPPNSGG